MGRFALNPWPEPDGVDLSFLVHGLVPLVRSRGTPICSRGDEMLSFILRDDEERMYDSIAERKLSTTQMTYDQRPMLLGFYCGSALWLSASVWTHDADAPFFLLVYVASPSTCQAPLAAIGSSVPAIVDLLFCRSAFLA